MTYLLKCCKNSAWLSGKFGVMKGAQCAQCAQRCTKVNRVHRLHLIDMVIMSYAHWWTLMIVTNWVLSSVLCLHTTFSPRRGRGLHVPAQGNRSCCANRTACFHMKVQKPTLQVLTSRFTTANFLWVCLPILSRPYNRSRLYRPRSTWKQI